MSKIAAKKIEPYEVLIALNGLEPVDFDSLHFAVITDPADERFDVARQEFIPEPWWWPFNPGEVLVLGPDGREPFGAGRKPGKWGVTCVDAESFADAMRLRNNALARHQPEDLAGES